MKEQIIRLEAHDNITSVRDKMGWIRASRVLLVLPDDPRTPILQRKLDLLLIQREATRLSAQLALITHDPIVIENAKELGIITFRSVEASHKRHWQTAQTQLAIERSKAPSRLNPSLAFYGTQRRFQRQGWSPRTQRIASVILLVVVLVSVLSGLYILLPSATVILSPATNQVNVTTTIIADPTAEELLIDQNIIPARIVGVEVESSATTETSGTSDEPTEKARGVALFTNLIPDQVTIPAGTIVRTSAAQPVRFITLVDATLPGQIGESIEVPIEALEPGYSGNLPIGRINQVEGLLSSRVGVTNGEPTQGGDEKEIPAISQEDMERLQALVIQQIHQRAYAEMLTNPFINLQDSEFVPLESLEVVLVHMETYQGYIGQPAETVSLTMRVTVQGVAIDERFARQVVYARLADKVGTGYHIGTGSLIFRRDEVTDIGPERQITFIMQGAGNITVAIEEDEVKALIKGKSSKEAISALSLELPLDSEPTIEVWPKFWVVMPTLPTRIQIEVLE